MEDGVMNPGVGQSWGERKAISSADATAILEKKEAEQAALMGVDVAEVKKADKKARKEREAKERKAREEAERKAKAEAAVAAKMSAAGTGAAVSAGTAATAGVVGGVNVTGPANAGNMMGATGMAGGMPGGAARTGGVAGAVGVQAGMANGPVTNGQMMNAPAVQAGMNTATGQAATGVNAANNTPGANGNGVVNSFTSARKKLRLPGVGEVLATNTAAKNRAAEKRRREEWEKQTKDPEKVKKIVKKIALIAGGVAVAAAGVVVLVLALRVDYGETYRMAKELKVQMNAYVDNRSCQYVASYAGATSVNAERYAEYVEGCETEADKVEEMTRRLGETAGVRRNKAIRGQYEEYQAVLEGALPDKTELGEKLALYTAWHEYELEMTGKTMDDVTQEELAAAAGYLINSGNEALAKYGDGWLEKTAAYARATQEFNAAGYGDANKGTLRMAMEQARVEQRDWLNENHVDLTEVAPLGGGNAGGGGAASAEKAEVSSEFTTLYEMIAKKYAEHYDKASGDCTEFRGQIVCS